jgi:hypothetical protein
MRKRERSIIDGDSKSGKGLKRGPLRESEREREREREKSGKPPTPPGYVGLTRRLDR